MRGGAPTSFAGQGRGITLSASERIFNDAKAAYGDRTHPCHWFVEVQTSASGHSWQLPIPFIGDSANLGLVFLGFNPSWNEDQPDPTLGTPFEEFDRYWRGYFETTSRPWPRLYEWYQRIGERAVGSQFRLGRDALVLEIVRYRSARTDGPIPRSALDHELPTTNALFQEIRPQAVLCCGGDALWYLGEMLPGLMDQFPQPFRVTGLEGQILRVKVPWGHLSVVPSRHLTGAASMSNDQRTRLGDVLGRALELAGTE